jgi:hypothetical protein
LKGSPTNVTRFCCRNNNLQTLDGAPRYCHVFDCSYNKLKTLEGGPSFVNSDYLCNNNELITLKGACGEIKNKFDCGNNNLDNLRYLPRKHYVEGSVYKVGIQINSKIKHLMDIYDDVLKDCLFCWGTPVYELLKCVGNSHRTYKRSINKYDWYDIKTDTIYRDRFLEFMASIKKEKQGKDVLELDVIKNNYNIV